MISFIFSFKIWQRKVLAAIYLGIVAVLSLMPAHDLPGIARYQVVHKIAHICMYLGLAFIALWSLRIRPDQMKLIYLLLAGIFMYGVLMEILQRSMHNGRTFHFSDMLANLTGAITGIIIYRYMERKWETLSVNE
jgi:VanZ family protein